MMFRFLDHYQKLKNSQEIGIKRVVRPNPGAHRATPAIGAPNVTEGTSNKEKPF